MGLKEQLEEIFAKYKDIFSGACLIKKENQIFLHEAKGLANRDFDIPNRTNTRFDTASVTKVFTAIAVLLLVEQKMLKLTDKIHNIIDLDNTSIPTDVLIEQLLNHTSGIADDADEEAGEDYSVLFVEKPNYSIRNCADFLPQFAYKKSAFKAGTNVRYNNCAFVLLGLAIEKLTGMSYCDFVTVQIFEKAGMTNTYFGAMDEIRPNTAEGYFALKDAAGNFEKWKKNIYSYPPIGTADGGALTTVWDLDVLMRALKSGALLSPRSTESLFKPQCSFTRDKKIGTWRTGYAFEFIESDDEIFCMYKEGYNKGADAMFSYYPKLDISIDILANQNGPLWKMHREMQAVLFDEVRRT